MKLARRMGRLGTETAFEVLARARKLEAEGRDVIHLEIGEPDFDTPENVIEAGRTALDSGATHYTPTAGIPELREAIAEGESRRKGISATAANVVVSHDMPVSDAGGLNNHRKSARKLLGRLIPSFRRQVRAAKRRTANSGALSERHEFSSAPSRVVSRGGWRFSR